MVKFELDEHNFANAKIIDKNMEEIFRATIRLEFLASIFLFKMQGDEIPEAYLIHPYFTGDKIEEFNNDKCFTFSNLDQIIKNINIDSEKILMKIKGTEGLYRNIIKQIESDKTNLKQGLQ